MGKQRSEAKILLDAISVGNGWSHHPIARMWKGHDLALTEYYNLCIEEWISRGYKNNMPIIEINQLIVYPEWLGDERVHGSHRSNLLRKNPEYYGRFGWTESPDIPYFWVKKA